jgi:Protein of unknown function (DUF3750)
MDNCKRILRFFGVLFLLLFLGPFWNAVTNFPANREQSLYKKLQLPQATDQAMICLYGARAGRWQTNFSLHTWIACKKKNEGKFTLYQVVRDQNPITGKYLVTDYGKEQDQWQGYPAYLLFYMAGEEAERLIPKVEQAIAAYPYQGTYHVWPGPNCNTFTAYIARAIPELGMTLPPHAIGKNFLIEGRLWDLAPSATGFEFSLAGVLSILLAREEGIVFNILGLNFGGNLYKGTLILPGIGQIALVDDR